MLPARVALLTAVAIVLMAPSAASADSGLLTFTKMAYASTRTAVGHLYDDGGYRDCDLTCDGWVRGYTWTGTPPSETVHATPAAGWAFGSWTEGDGSPGDPCTDHPGGAADACTAQPAAPVQHQIHANFVDIGKPSATIGNVGSGPYRGTVSGISVSGIDHQTNVVSTALLVDGTVVSAQPGAIGSHRYLTPAGQGQVTLVPRATDQGGNSAIGTGITIRYDNVSPTVRITGGPAEGASTPAGDVTFTFSAADSNAISVECAADGAPYGRCTSADRHTIAAPALGTHTFRLRATDAPGNRTELIRTFKVVPLPLPSPSPSPSASVQASLSFEFAVHGARTRILRLVATNVPRGGAVRVGCTGRGCPFHHRSIAVRSNGSASITHAFGHRKLRAGTVVEVRITAPGMTGMVVRLTMRKGRAPLSRRLCLPVGAKAPERCSP